MRGRALWSVVVAAAVSGPAQGQDPLLSSSSFRLVGPYRGGRVTAVAGVPGEPGVFYMGSTGGGVWKTTDAGATWRNVSDLLRELEPSPEPEVMGEVDPRLAAWGLLRPPVEGLPEGPVRRVRRGGDPFGSASIGAVAVAPSDHNVVWVGTGSACIRGNVSPGDGVYRSTDAGDTWRHMGLAEAGQIGRIVVHPTDPDVVWVAALGHAFGPNPERGVYRSTDGGLSWSKVLFVSDRAGAVDLAMDPSNPRVLFAAVWEAERKPWTVVSGGADSGLFKSTDGGNTWVRLSEGLPEGPLGRIAVAVSPAAPRRVWALVEAEEGGLFRSDDGGARFRLVSADRELRQRAWYYTHVTADPADPDTVWVLNVFLWRSVDGGASFTPVRAPHGDHHALWIDPDDPATMILGDDGGAAVTANGGGSWSTQGNQPTAEIYRLTVDGRRPYWLYGGQQDNSAVAIPSRTGSGGIARHHWYAPAGCETATVAVDPRDPDVTYGGCYGGALDRYDRRLDHHQQVSAWPQLAVGQRAADLRFRFQWNAPIRISPHDPAVLYHCSNHVHRSRDEGLTWEVISPDLSRDDPARQGYAGGPITRDNTGVEVYGTVFAFEESPLRPGLLWAGSDDGRVHLSPDAGATWQDITPAAMPEWATVNAIELSPHDPGRAFLAVHRYRLDDFRPYIFRTDDGGATWVSLADGRNGIPADHFVRVVREDPARRGLLFAGTEFGLYASFDDGRTWRSLQLDLPITPITDLAVVDGDLVVATQGRSFWILDDLTAVRAAAGGLEPGVPHLLEPRPAVRWVDGSGGGARPPVGQNPPFGAILHYVLPEGFDGEGEEATEVRLEVLDAEGAVLRTLSSTTPEPQAPSLWRRFFPELAEPPLLDARPGANRWVWNLRLADARLVDDAVLWGSAAGPVVPPGTYRARLTVGAWSGTVELEVEGDPRLDVPAEAHRERFELARSVWRQLTRSHDVLRLARDVRRQAEERAARSPDDEAVQAAAQALTRALVAVEDEITQARLQSSQDVLNFPPQLDNQLAHLLGVVESAEGAPGEASRRRFAELERQLDGLVGELDEALAGPLGELEAALAASGAAQVVVDRPDEL